MEELANVVLEMASQKVMINDIKKETTYLVDYFDKLNERLNNMGRLIVNNNKEMTEKMEAAAKVTGPTYPLMVNQSEQTGELAKAMAKAKCAFGTISRGATANRGKFSSLTDMIEITMPILEANGIDASFFVGTNEQKEFTITLKVTHSSNQWYQTCALLRDDQSGTSINFHQRIGFAEKYIRRYMYRAMFNLSEEE